MVSEIDMKIQDLLEKAAKESIGLDVLTTLAADRAAAGDDVLAAYRSQAELRSAAAQKVLTDSKDAGRADLLASEQRTFDQSIRERDSILGLILHIEQRTMRSYAPPSSQRLTDAPDEDVSPVLTRDQKFSEYITRRGGARFAGERGRLRFGAIVRALALGDRRGLSELEQRALSEGSDSAGGYTVPEIVAGQFIDRVRNAMVVMRAGAQTVPMTSDTLNIARVANDGIVTATSPLNSAANWKEENDDISEGDIELERVQFIARTLPVLCRLSVELSEDSVNVDQIIERELSQALALELDRAALLGSGVAPEPKGVRFQSGVLISNFAGHEPTNYDFIVDSIGRIWAANHEPNARIYNSDLATAIAKFKDTTGQPLAVPADVAAVTAFRTNQIDNDGGSPTATMMFVGDFSQLMIGLRTSFRLEMSRIAGDAFGKLQIAVRAYLRADVQLAHPEAFNVTTNIG